MEGTSWQEAQNILCVRLDSMGDVLMTTPAIRALKESHPGRKITLLTSPAGSSLASLIPEVDEEIVYEAPWMKATADRKDRAVDLQMVATLRQKRFDGAVIFTVFSQNPLPAALFCYLAEIPLRAAHCRENPYQLLTDWVPETDFSHAGSGPVRHEVRRQLDLAAAIGSQVENERLSLRVPDEAFESVERLLQSSSLDLSRPWVVIHPGASAPSRRYPPERFAQVASCMVEDHAHQVIFTGNTYETELVQEIQGQVSFNTFSCVGQLDLGQLSALIAMAPLLITNNTGPAHIAAAVGTPLVDLYALTNPQHTPWQVPHRLLYQDVPCKFCYKSICPFGHNDCLHLVTPQTVVKAALDLLQPPRLTG